MRVVVTTTIIEMEQYYQLVWFMAIAGMGQHYWQAYSMTAEQVLQSSS
jgi:hypothetical protein